jgi:hypothetical protein
MRLSIRQVVERLKKEGHRTPQGKLWHRSGMTLIPKNPRYAGRNNKIRDFVKPILNPPAEYVLFIISYICCPVPDSFSGMLFIWGASWGSTFLALKLAAYWRARRP